MEDIFFHFLPSSHLINILNLSFSLAAHLKVVLTEVWCRWVVPPQVKWSNSCSSWTGFEIKCSSLSFSHERPKAENIWLIKTKICSCNKEDYNKVSWKNKLRNKAGYSWGLTQPETHYPEPLSGTFNTPILPHLQFSWCHTTASPFTLYITEHSFSRTAADKTDECSALSKVRGINYFCSGTECVETCLFWRKLPGTFLL